MQFKRVYQRWLELQTPPGVGAGSAPLWSWPVGLSDGRTILTLLWRELGGSGGPLTMILELSPTGEAQVWKPGVGYPAPVIVCALKNDDLVGLDLVKMGKLYACRPDGTHRWALAASVRMDCLVAPQSLHEQGGQLHWMDAAGVRRAADIGGEAPIVLENPHSDSAPTGDVHFPHTHFIGDRLYVMDFDPMARISVYQAQG